MGSRGPVPKRIEERLGHLTKAQKAGTDRVTMEGAVKPPPMPRGLHPIAQRWYRSLVNSGQSRFYEPSDWATAVYVAEVMSRNLNDKKFSAMLFASVMSAMDTLLTTEGARRRVRVEIVRDDGEEDAQPGVTAIDDYRNRLASQ